MRILSYILTFLIPFYAMAQQSAFEKQWKTIDQAIANGQFKSLEPQLAALKAETLKAKDDANYIKTLFYQAKIKIATTEETDDVNFVFETFQQEINGKSKVRDAVIQLYLAKLYTYYLNDNEYTIRNRTELETQTSKDVRFWTYQIFINKIKELYQKAIHHKSELLKADITIWKPLLINSESDIKSFNEAKELTPTLYDVVVHDYIDYLMTQNDVNKDKANQYLQELAKLNSDKGQFNAFLFNQHQQLNNHKEKLSYDELIKEYENLATIYFKEASYSAIIYNDYVSYLMNDEHLKSGSYKIIFEIEKQLKAKYPDHQATKSVIAQANTIRAKQIQLTTDQYVVPNQNIPLNVSHKNVSQLFVRVYENPFIEGKTNLIQNLNAYESSELKKAYKEILKLKKIDEYSIDLKSFDDYQSHSSIYKFNPLKAGRYIVLYSTDDQFNYDVKTEQVYFNQISVTPYNIVFNDQKLYVTDRETGKPLVNTLVEIFGDDNTNTKIEELKTNEIGMIQLNYTNRHLQYRVKNDAAIYSNYIYRSPSKHNEEETITAQILTDRAIYRPNQTVYFKTIVYKSFKKESEVLANTDVLVVLKDVNGKEVAKLDGTTNEFGSFNGQFQLPNSGLTGNYQIYVLPKTKKYSSSGYKSIRVEEYKRPKFEVKVDEHKNVYQINDQIKVNGKAEAFSGATIDNAVVKYRVYRQELFSFWPWYRTIPSGRSAKEEIAFGETKTDEQGKYTFDFIAKPVEPRKDIDRLYNYMIEVNVTDINGETQTTTSTIKVGDRRLILNVHLNDRISAKDAEQFKISVTNVNDIKQNGKGQLAIYALENPKQVLRTTRFNTDYNYYSENEFRKLFPHQPYGEELTPKNRKLGTKVFETSFDTSISDQIHFAKAKDLEENYYIVKGFVYDGDQKVEIERIIYIENANKINASTLLAVTTDKENYKVGEKAKVTFQSAEKEGYVYYTIGTNNKTEKEGVIELKKNNSITIPITSAHLGNLGVSYFIVKHNDVITGVKTINVPMESKDLKITTEVFRDKLKPGQEEKWQIKITGNEKDKVSAEVLATMYDASLDQFVGHNAQFNPNYYRSNYIRNAFANLSYGSQLSYAQQILWRNFYDDVYVGGDYTNGLIFSMFDFSFNAGMYNRIWYSNDIAFADVKVAGGINMERKEVNSMNAPSAPSATTQAPKASPEPKVQEIEEQINQVQARKVLNETAFFYPNLKTDAEGNVIIEFTAPESLTEWKLMTLAHTKDLKVGYLENRVKTQKELMIVPNAPRFLREGDQVAISTKVNNLSDKLLNGTAKLMLFDPFTNEPIDAKFNLNNSTQNFSVSKGNSDQVTWVIDVPKNVQAVVYRVVAVAGEFSDGEELALPILTNRMLVTETMPIFIKENQSKTFNFKNLQENKSATLDHFKLTFEMTANPIWNAIFALPYLREYPYECAEQVFSRLYGNMVSEKIITSNQKIKAVFDQWNAKGELKSKLQLNEELKAIILEETPWVRSAEREETQMKQIATLFQMNQMQQEMKAAFEKLSAKQQSNGGFAWFEGGRPNEYITTHIVAGFGNLKRMEVNFKAMNIDATSLVNQSIQFIDQENLRRYTQFKKDLKSFKNITYSDGIHYLYARSFFLDSNPMGKELEEMKNVMLKNLNDKKLDLSLQQKAMAALVLKRFGMESAAKQTLISVKERAVESDEMGMYWKDNKAGWFWHDAPVETQAMLIEAFDEVLKDTQSVEEMKVWLIKNKQTNQWNSTKATTKAVYALMNTGKSWIDAEKGVKVNIGNQPFNIEENTQAGTGYVKTSWNKEEIKPEMGKVEVSKTSPGVAYGAMYWQYFEDLDQIKSAETGIKFNKRLYVKSNTASGPVLKEITPQTPIQVGDIVTVRLEISVDRTMQFVHIKDMRASGFEPVNVLSGYKWKGEFGYYESTRDASTNFFADYMRKGTYVFEYDLKANNAGNFSNGITSMQNMYAPELSAHSEGIRVEIKN